MTKDGERAEVATTEAIQAIADLTGADPNAIYQTLAADPRIRTSPTWQKAVTLDVFKQVRALQIPWVYSELHPSRTYPSGAIAGNLVGFIGTDGPQAGTELKQDDVPRRRRTARPPTSRAPTACGCPAAPSCSRRRRTAAPST